MSYRSLTERDIYCQEFKLDAVVYSEDGVSLYEDIGIGGGE